MFVKMGSKPWRMEAVLTISEKVDTEERNVCIDIHDTGPGIPMFVIDKIFDPFFTTKDTGTGLRSFGMSTNYSRYGRDDSCFFQGLWNDVYNMIPYT